MKKSGNKWSTEKCGRCYQPHSGYSGKLDSKGIEYVVCGLTHKRMDVSGVIDHNTKAKTLVFATHWEKDGIQ